MEASDFVCDSFIYGPCCLVSPDMCDYRTVSQIFNFLFSLGINSGSVNLVPQIDNLEVQIYMGVSFE